MSVSYYEQIKNTPFFPYNQYDPVNDIEYIQCIHTPHEGDRDADPRLLDLLFFDLASSEESPPAACELSPPFPPVAEVPDSGTSPLMTIVAAEGSTVAIPMAM